MTSSYQSILRPGCFQDKAFIVTGAGSGIGRCIAHELSSLGAQVILMGRTLSKLESVATEIEEDGGRSFCIPVDIRDELQVQQAIETALKHTGKIAGLVNNAGGQFPAPLSHINQKGFETVVRTNLVGGFLMARALFNLYFQKNGGAIVNITADCVGGMPGMGHSGAARAGMENFTKTAALEWAPARVRVNAVAPGVIATSGLDTYDPTFQHLIKRIEKQIPLGRFGNEAEVSGLVCFLLSDAAQFITGSTMRVDGGGSLVTTVPTLPTASSSPSFQGFHRAKLPEILQSSTSETTKGG